MAFEFGPRRGTYLDVTEILKTEKPPLSSEELGHFETLDLIYRSLCALLYNYVPMSGHPGGLQQLVRRIRILDPEILWR